MAADNFRNLTVYKKAFALAMEIFQISKKFPKEEKFDLTSQIRRSSRSVCSSVGEAYRKREYERYFVNKASDADGENTETRVWLDFAYACNYITLDIWEDLESKAFEVGALLNHMIENPERYRRPGGSKVNALRSKKAKIKE
jgi:four helix bundle protein